MGLVGKTMSPVLNVGLGLPLRHSGGHGTLGLDRSNPEMPLWIPQPAETPTEEAG